MSIRGSHLNWCDSQNVEDVSNLAKICSFHLCLDLCTFQHFSFLYCMWIFVGEIAHCHVPPAKQDV